MTLTETWLKYISEIKRTGFKRVPSVSDFCLLGKLDYEKISAELDADLVLHTVNDTIKEGCLLGKYNKSIAEAILPKEHYVSPETSKKINDLIQEYKEEYNEERLTESELELCERMKQGEFGDFGRLPYLLTGELYLWKMKQQQPPQEEPQQEESQQEEQESQEEAEPQEDEGIIIRPRTIIV